MYMDFDYYPPYSNAPPERFEEKLISTYNVVMATIIIIKVIKRFLGHTKVLGAFLKPLSLKL